MKLLVSPIVFIEWLIAVLEIWGVSKRNGVILGFKVSITQNEDGMIMAINYNNLDVHSVLVYEKIITCRNLNDFR